MNNEIKVNNEEKFNSYFESETYIVEGDIELLPEFKVNGKIIKIEDKKL